MKADESTFYAILGRALAEEGFRERLVNPDTRVDTLAEAGLELTDEGRQSLDDAIEAIVRMGDEFSEETIAS
jgi:hypothetical protein